jgi:hypothetical protein
MVSKPGSKYFSHNVEGKPKRIKPNVRCIEIPNLVDHLHRAKYRCGEDRYAKAIRISNVIASDDNGHRVLKHFLAKCSKVRKATSI